ncbi:MAG TPA: glycosyltransferase family 4 protein [Candidatus Dormibacteraeota bacterium]|nr:glycosyltransferase family 4 protein [Candidatus Dormibacteraeota bacterium]
MKLLVFAHTPPPHHGQSYMVQLMLEGFGGDQRHPNTPSRDNRAAALRAEGGRYGVECYHVNARLSQKLEDIGDLRIGKFILLIGYCFQAIWCRFRYGVTNFYYIPAPGKPSALYRDWMVMLLCRWCFKRIILHWHAAGLAKWLEMVVQMRSRSLTYHFMRQPDLSIVLSQYNRADAEKIYSRQITIIGNGIPDPCPDFERAVLARRKARFAARKKLLSGQALQDSDLRDTGGDPREVRVLYLAHCTREKGLFDTVKGVALASRRLAERKFPVSLKLMVAGTFVSAEQKAEFDKLLAEPGMQDVVQYFGFVSGEQKEQLLREADLFCFPTYYENENQPVNLIEAMAFGLPILTTRWRSLPELFPVDYPGLVDIRSPEQIANVMPALMTGEAGDGFRDIFLRSYTLERHLTGLADALHKVEQPAAEPGMVVFSDAHGK